MPEDLRGQGVGTRAHAARRGLGRATQGLIGIWLDTFEFQARGFYEKLGFTVFGTLEDHPVGSRRYFCRSA